MRDQSAGSRHAPAAEVARLQGLLVPTDGSVPRVSPARPRQLGPLARIVAEVAGRVSGGGPPNVFTTLGRNPRLFRAWLRYSAHLMPLGRLPRRDTELVILRVAWRCRSAYEWHQHTPLALRAGLTPEEIAGVAGGPSADGFTPRQRTLLSATDEMLARGELTDGTWSAVQAIFRHREVIELCLLVGHYQGLSTAIGALGIQVESDARGPA